MVFPSSGWIHSGTSSAAGSRAKRRSCNRGCGSSRTRPRRTAERAISRSRSSARGPQRTSCARFRPSACSRSRHVLRRCSNPLGQSIRAAALRKSGCEGPTGRVRHRDETAPTCPVRARDSRARRKAFRGWPRLPPRPIRMSISCDHSHTIATLAPFKVTAASAKVRE